MQSRRGTRNGTNKTSKEFKMNISGAMTGNTAAGRKKLVHTGAQGSVLRFGPTPTQIINYSLLTSSWWLECGS